MSGLSIELEEQHVVLQDEDSTAETSKKPIRSYTREFLISLSELEVCRKLPEEFDKSLLSEFEELSSSTQDRPRVLGSSSVQGFKRADYGSSVPAKGDSGNYPRGLNRWDSRSSGRSDTDTDSESGRRYGSQARRSWQSPEHDGLLGSGSFPRPAGFAAGAPVPRLRPNENASLSRSNEPYQPPRPYKAIPHSRREITDSLNDETFGSADDTNEDRVEEEKKRRAEFELMRKEQHKALQDNQKSNKGKTEDLFSDLTNSSDSKNSNDLDKVLKPTSQDEYSKLSVSAQPPLSRPLVPPGFVSGAVDKSSTAKSLVHAESPEMGKSELKYINQDVKTKAPGRISNDIHSQTSSTSEFKSEIMLDPPVLPGASHAKALRLPDASEVLENGMGLDFEVTGPKLLGEPARSTSILDKLFGNALTASDDSTSKLVEDDAKTVDTRGSNAMQSKFARWFPEEERKSSGDVSSEKPNNLLSLIGGGEISGSSVPGSHAIESILVPETTLGHKTSNLASTAETSEHFSDSYVTEAKPAVLTCEDLEQSILSEIGGDSLSSRPGRNEKHVLEVKEGNRGNAIDNQASHHLLSLLQKGIGSKDAASIPGVEERPPGKLRVKEAGRVLDGNVNDAEVLNSPGKALTLESLFGSAFMKELHSAQNNTTGSAKRDVSDGAFFPPTMNENGINHLASNDGITNLDKVGEWLGFNDSLKEADLSKQPTEYNSKFGGIDGSFEAKLPEEDSLINLIDPTHAENPMLVSNSRSFKSDLLPSSSSMPADILQKLAALGGALNDERSMAGGHDPRMLRGPYDMIKPELQYQNMHPQASSPQLHSSQINQSRPLFHNLDSNPVHLDQQLNFMPPEAVMRRDTPTHHQFPGNMGHPSFPHPSAGLPGFDQPIPPAALQQMHMAGNLPPPHLARGFSGGAPMPPHPSLNPAGYIQEPNPLQNFPFGQRQPYYGGPGMGPAGPELGVANNPPDAFQRLLEMELRGNPKQMHPFAAASPSQPMYGHELDTGFRYR